MSEQEKATIRERIIRRLGAVPERAAARRANEAYGSGYNDGGEDEPPSGTLAKFGYSRTTTGGLRDFSLIDPETVLSIVWTLWQSNPIIKRGSQIKRDYILDRGIYPQTQDQKLQEVLDMFWSNNKMDKRSKEFVLQLFLSTRSRSIA
jgi:hypothetical protein